MIMWLGELITERGIGNGMSILIFTSVVSAFPGALWSIAKDPTKGYDIFAIVILIGLVIIAAVIFIEQAQRRIPVQYARRMVGRKMFGGTSTYIPLKVNQAGVIPVIFASSLLYLPALASQFNQTAPWSAWVNRNFVRGDHPYYMITYFLLIVFFTYFYVAITFNPNEVADNMKKYGGFVPGIRAGKPTEDYLGYVLSRITFPGSLYLGLVALVPLIALVLVQANQNFPVRRDLAADHGGCGARHRQTDREPASAAALRRVPSLMRLLFVGPPGAGKGTQAAIVADQYAIPQISTGDIFRANVSAGTDLGLKAQGFMDAGEYVPDEVTNEMVRSRLGEPDTTNGFLLDGFPRTADQVDALDAILDEAGTPLDAVLVLEVDLEELISRLLERAKTSGRSDDTEEVIRRRQEVYFAQTQPVLDLYSARGLLVRVDGSGSVTEVADRVGRALSQQAANEA